MGALQSLQRCLTSLLLTLAMLLSVLSPAAAAEAPIRLIVDGQELKTDVPPQIIDGRTMVPVRVVADHLGFGVEWNESTQTVRLTGLSTVVLRLGSAQAWVDGRAVTLDVPAQSVQGRTLVPLRFIAQAVGYDVAWDPVARVVRLTAPRVRVSQMSISSQVEGQVAFTVDRDERGFTVVSGRIDPRLGWKVIGLAVAAEEGTSHRKAAVTGGEFTVTAAVPGGQPVTLYLLSESGETFARFTVLHPEEVRPRILSAHGVEIVDYWTTEAGDRLSVTVIPGGILRVEGTLRAEAAEGWLSGSDAATLLTLENGRFEAAVPLSGPARHRLCIYVESQNRGCVVAEQTAESRLEPITRWGHHVRLDDPVASGVTVGDSMRVAGQVRDIADPVLHVDVKKLGGEELVSRQRLAIRSGRFDGLIWFPFGAGAYEITVWRPDENDANRLWSAARWSVTSTVQEDLRWRIPTAGVESDAPEIIALAEEITRGRPAPAEKARAIHDWVARNVAYDMEKFVNQSFQPDDGALKTLAVRKGVCQDYAYLTAALLRASGIKARIAYGKANGYGGWGDHAWIEAWVGDRWLTMDTTWDAGGINGGRFQWNFSTKYFDPDPQVFALDHRLEGYYD